MRKEVLSRREFLIGTVAVSTVIIVDKWLKKRYLLPDQSLSHQTELSEMVKNLDVLLVFNPGGKGGTSLDKDPLWQEILEKIAEQLEGRGYKTAILENPRSLLFTQALQKTTRLIEEIINFNPQLNIILTGKSTGASFVEELLGELKQLECLNIFAIEAGRPFSQNRLPILKERTLVIPNPTDPLVRGDALEIIKQALPPKIYYLDENLRPPDNAQVDIRLGRIAIDFPVKDHDTCYTWTQDLEKMINNFFDCHFPSKNKQG